MLSVARPDIRGETTGGRRQAADTSVPVYHRPPSRYEPLRIDGNIYVGGPLQTIRMVRNVALLVLDSVRKDSFDAHAPRLQALADVSLDWCYAASSWSAPSHASIITGDLPHEHGVHAHQKDFAGLTRADTFLADLPDHRLVGASTNVYAGSPFHFDDLFDEFDSLNKHGALPGGVNVDEFVYETGGGPKQYLSFLRQAYAEDALVPSVVNGALVKLDDLFERLSLPRVSDYGAGTLVRSGRRLTETEPFFFFANFMDAHVPHKPTFAFDSSLYDVPREWSSRKTDRWEINNNPGSEAHAAYLRYFRELYAASIDYLDRRVSAFVKELLKRTDHETTVVVTADHGEELGFPEESGRIGHVTGLSHAHLHIPLLVINPPTNADIDAALPCSQLDLGDLLVELSRDELITHTREYVPAERIGLSQSGDIENAKYWDRAIRCAYHGDDRYEWDSLGNRLRYAVTGNSVEELVDEDAEIPTEARSAFDGDLAAYKREAAEMATTVEVDTATEQRLRELGYM